MIDRILNFSECSRDSAFLWGPRQTGKSTLVRARFPAAKRIDLLLADEYRRYLSDPTLLRQECIAEGLTEDTQTGPIVIDEVQTLPVLLDECHWLMEARGLRFLFCGSSARKLLRQQGNLLGGRALRLELFPFTSAELPEFDLDRALNHGLLPRHYLSPSPRRLLRAYVGDYLREEIQAQALTRNIPAFARFLEVAALANGELVSYSTIARDCGVSGPTVKGYYQILADTLLGFTVPAFRRREKRRLIRAPKFYLFDVGVAAELTHRGRVEAGSELFGRAFEHFIAMELRAHASYSRLDYPVRYWRTAAGQEVDFVLGDGQVAVEVKASARVREQQLRGLKAFREEHPDAEALVVSLDDKARRLDSGIAILPWRDFLGRLWSGEVMRA